MTTLPKWPERFGDSFGLGRPSPFKSLKQACGRDAHDHFSIAELAGPWLFAENQGEFM